MTDWPEPDEGPSPLMLAGMTPWLCEYDGPDGVHGIVLYGTDSAQVLEDNCAELPGLRIEGIVYAVIE
jgi:hypothetical protein